MPAPERALDRAPAEAGTLSERAATLIEQDILAGHLAPGSRLGIVDLVQLAGFLLAEAHQRAGGLMRLAEGHAPACQEIGNLGRPRETS